jgi:prephenate dehydrogenase
MKVSVVGLGLIGGSIGIDLRHKGFATELIGVENSPQHAQQALKLSLVDRIEDLSTAAAQSELVILAVPVTAMKAILPSLLDQIPDETTVTDMGSTKEQLSQVVASHPKRKNFVASHPMAGTENSGPQAALPGLFQGKTAVICDSDLSGPIHLDRVKALYQALGMRWVEMTSTEHDMKVAFVSHLSHISSFALANTVLDKERDVKTIFDLAGGGFESTVRLAKSSPDMWAPIFEQNRENILSALDSYITHLYSFREAIATIQAGNPPANRRETACVKLMERANEIRRVLNKDGKK